MIIVDTSIWIDHIHSPIDALGQALLQGEILHHDFVTAEIALGSVSTRVRVIERLNRLPKAGIVGWDDLLVFIDRRALSATGVGFVDVHLLASANASSARLWTRDKRLAAQAERLGLDYSPA